MNVFNLMAELYQCLPEIYLCQKVLSFASTDLLYTPEYFISAAAASIFNFSLEFHPFWSSLQSSSFEPEYFSFEFHPSSFYNCTFPSPSTIAPFSNQQLISLIRE